MHLGYVMYFHAPCHPSSVRFHFFPTRHPSICANVEQTLLKPRSCEPNCYGSRQLSVHLLHIIMTLCCPVVRTRNCASMPKTMKFSISCPLQCTVVRTVLIEDLRALPSCLCIMSTLQCTVSSHPTHNHKCTHFERAMYEACTSWYHYSMLPCCPYASAPLNRAHEYSTVDAESDVYTPVLCPARILYCTPS